PNPNISTYTKPSKEWIVSIPQESEIQLHFIENQNNNVTDKLTGDAINNLFLLKLGWALKSNQTLGRQDMRKRMLLWYVQVLRHEVAAERQNIVDNNNKERSDNLVDNPDQSGNSNQNVQENRSSSSIEKR
ncbi:15264_t:CDS:2, partial [Acaulospora morrowiae]